MIWNDDGGGEEKVRSSGGIHWMLDGVIEGRSNVGPIDL